LWRRVSHRRRPLVVRCRLERGVFHRGHRDGERAALAAELHRAALAVHRTRQRDAQHAPLRLAGAVSRPCAVAKSLRVEGWGCGGVMRGQWSGTPRVESLTVRRQQLHVQPARQQLHQQRAGCARGCGQLRHHAAHGAQLTVVLHRAGAGGERGLHGRCRVRRSSSSERLCSASYAPHRSTTGASPPPHLRSVALSPPSLTPVHTDPVDAAARWMRRTVRANTTQQSAAIIAVVGAPSRRVLLKTGWSEQGTGAWVPAWRWTSGRHMRVIGRIHIHPNHPHARAAGHPNPIPASPFKPPAARSAFLPVPTSGHFVKRVTQPVAAIAFAGGGFVCGEPERDDGRRAVR
jgi:hypothetical protein